MVIAPLLLLMVGLGGPADGSPQPGLAAISPWATGITEEENIRKWLVVEATALAGQGKTAEALATIERAEKLIGQYTKANDIPEWDVDIARLYQMAQSKRASLQANTGSGSDKTSAGAESDGKLTTAQLKQLSDVRKALKDASSLLDAKQAAAAQGRVQTVFKYLDEWVATNRVPKWHRSVAPLYQQTAGLAEDIDAAEGKTEKKSAQSARAPKAGDPAPPLQVPGLNGTPISSKDLAGKWVVIDFWATWCGPCRAAMPELKRMHDRYGKDSRFALVSISLDTKPATAKAYVAQNGFTWTHGIVVQGFRAAAVKTYGVNGIPTILLISPEGKILVRGHGSSATNIAKMLEKALAKPPAPAQAR